MDQKQINNYVLYAVLCKELTKDDNTYNPKTGKKVTNQKTINKLAKEGVLKECTF